MKNNYVINRCIFKPKLNNSFGFTLLEILLSITILAALAGVSMPLYQSFQVTNDLDIAANTIAQICRKAIIMSQGMSGDITWGVEVQAGSIVLFKGASYASRDIAYDEIFALSESITPSGNQELLFNKLSGLPVSAYSLTLTGNNSQVRNITINTKGLVEY